MSDLISRSELLKRLEEWNTSDETDKALYNFAFHRIIEQPTAYDIDKIVDELEKREEHYVEMLDWQCQSAICDAIEIVKHGGVSDDCCEWESHRNNYVTSCEEDFVPMMRGYKYCPYCGKKIKVVE